MQGAKCKTRGENVKQETTKKLKEGTNLLSMNKPRPLKKGALLGMKGRNC